MEQKAGLKPILVIILLFIGLSPIAGNSNLPQNQPLNEVLDQISEKYQVIITYNSKLLSNIKVNFDFRTDESLEVAVNRALTSTGLRYKQLTDKYYIVFKDTQSNKKNIRKIQRKFRQIQKLEQEENLQVQRNSNDLHNPLGVILASAEEALKERDITGTVKDEEGIPLIGASVKVKGAATGTVTDLDGKFALTIADDVKYLEVSYIGYTTQEIAIGNASIVEIVLLSNVTELDEIVVVGYGTQQKSDLTGSVARANIESFRESPNVSVVQSLQGTVPGLNIGQVDATGENPSISVRGSTTINGNQNVLIVVDGIIFTGSLNELNPTDIESIDVLKDPSSMAIYGAQAANGVILIKTKGGNRTSKPAFTYTASYTTQNPSNELTTFDREGFINKSFDIDWETSFEAPDYTRLRSDWTYDDIVTDPPLRAGFENGTNYDWWANATNPGYINAHNLSVRGSEGKVSYFLSGGYTDQKGYILNDEFQRVTTRINIENEILDWFTIGAQTFGSFSDYSGTSPSLGLLSRMTPLVTPWDENGAFIPNPNGANLANPFLISLADDFDKRNSIFGNFFADIDIPFIEGLNFRLNFGNNYRWNRQYNSNAYANSAAGSADKINNSWYDWTLDNILSYKRTFNEVHNLDVTLVYGRRERFFEQTAALGSNYNNLRLSYNDLGLGGIQLINSSAWNESYLYQMGRINYKFNYRYLLTATIRRDGFSGFARNEKTALFPSLGLGWVLSEEPFMDASWINNLKLRFSYGTNGNLVGRYSSLARLASFPAYVYGDGGTTLFGQEIQNLANPNLSWETTTGSNFGVDFILFGNKLSGSVDYYATTTSDLIFDVSIPQITGFNQITTNVGEIENRGLELTLNTTVMNRSDWNWNVTFNLASNRNKILSLIDLDADNDGQEDDLVASGLFLGESINSVFTYESDGIIQIGEEAPTGFFVGTHRIVDQNGDGAVTPNDRVIIGRQEPAYRFGILNEIKYKNFTFRFFLNSIQGGKDGYLGRNMLDGFGSGDNIRRNNFWTQYDYWTPSNPNARYRRLDQEPAVDYIYYGDRSFIRLQDITLAYDFDGDFLQGIGFDRLKLFVSGKNLKTWTKWEGWDPETGLGFGASGRPVLKGISFGLDATF